jgi:hypothetical protein
LPDDFLPFFKKFFVYKAGGCIFSREDSFMSTRNLNRVITVLAATIIVVVIIIPALNGGGANV